MSSPLFQAPNIAPVKKTLSSSVLVRPVPETDSVMTHLPARLQPRLAVPTASRVREVQEHLDRVKSAVIPRFRTPPVTSASGCDDTPLGKGHVEPLRGGRPRSHVALTRLTDRDTQPRSASIGSRALLIMRIDLPQQTTSWSAFAAIPVPSGTRGPVRARVASRGLTPTT